MPTPAGPGLGNGALVEVVVRFAEREPAVAGKPQPPLFEETLRRVGGSHPLVVGDRLDTDIEAAQRAGVDSLLVLTGVTDAAGAVLAPPNQRPTFVADDLAGLIEPHPAVSSGPDGFGCGGWTAR